MHDFPNLKDPFIEKYQLTSDKERFMTYGALMIGANNLSAVRLLKLAEDSNDAEMAKYLENRWQITDPQSASERITWLMETGSRQNPNYIAYLNEFREVKTGGFIKKRIAKRDFKDWLDSLESVVILKKGKEKAYLENETILNCKNVLAWDLERIAYLTRLCYNKGYLNERQVWLILEDVALNAKSYFNDWTEYIVSFLIGHFIWSDSTNLDRYRLPIIELFNGTEDQFENTLGDLYQRYPLQNI